MAYGAAGLWVADSSDQAVLELSPLTGSVLQTFSLDVHPTSIAFADGLVWVAAYDASTVQAIDPTSGQPWARLPSATARPRSASATGICG